MGNQRTLIEGKDQNLPEKPNASNDPVAYRSKVRIERVKGPIRRAHVPAHDGPVMLGVHSEVAEHYGVDKNVFDPYTTTLDYVVMATAG